MSGSPKYSEKKEWEKVIGKGRYKEFSINVEPSPLFIAHLYNEQKLLK